ncbi:MAG: discoidin domain-containing protein [Candidatus Eisenbacteria bacterium]
MKGPRLLLALVVSAALLALAGAGAGDDADAAPRILDSFDSIEAWSVHPSDGVSGKISSAAGVDGRALRLDFRFDAGAGWVIVRRALDLDLPENYAFRFRLRADGVPVNNLEFKLIDSTGENVWWFVRRDFEFPRDWTELSVKKRQIGFAWGPAGGGELRHVAALEIAISAGRGGEGTIWLDGLALEELPPPGAAPPRPIASATTIALPHTADRAVDGDSTTAWRPAASDATPALTLDMRVAREYGGVVLDWEPGGQPRSYAIETSSDGRSWQRVREVRDSDGGRDPLLLPESESRWLRVRVLERGDGPTGLREVVIEPLEWGATPEAFYRAIASDARRGDYPRAILGEPVAWTVIGTDQGEPEEALLDTDGRLETGKRSFSIEPFLYEGGKLITWADVAATPSLPDSAVPMPRVRWAVPAHELDLSIETFALDPQETARLTGADRPAPSPTVVARYRVYNRASAERPVTLFLAVRPFQVNPPVQFLNTPGGTTTIGSIERGGGAGENTVVVDGTRGFAAVPPPEAFGAATFDQGAISSWLRKGQVPPSPSASDPFAHASAALAWNLTVPAGGETEVDLLVPLRGLPPAPPAAAPAAPPAALQPDSAAIARAQAERAGRWLALRGPLAIEVPDSARDVVETIWAQLGWILINRDGAGIQPGSRSYDRSWIRDGSLTGTALIRLGHPEIAREFAEWFASYQFEDGKVPCCVDARGADPVPEHDSHGELVYLIARVYEATGDRAFLERMWPHVQAAASYLDRLRAERLTAEWRTRDGGIFYGILPPSISHEGYSAKPMHSYWDDLFALRGYRDAATIASILGRDGEAARLRATAQQFAADLANSIRGSMAAHGIDYVPGSADLGDFDATSTTIALDPVQAGPAVVPEGALRATFERYWDFFEKRATGAESWEAFTPYEIRNMGAFVRLGWRERAQELLRFLLAHREPIGWRQWPEVVWNHPGEARFVGDMPHTWCGSDYVRAALDLFAYENEADSSLVVGAGVPLDWLREEPGVRVRNLPTSYGPLSYSMSAQGDGVAVEIEEGIRVPPGGIVVRTPVAGGASASAAGAGGTAEARVTDLPAQLILQAP